MACYWGVDIEGLPEHGIEGRMSSGKYAKMTHTSQATAFRDIEELIDKGILRKAEEGGRSTNYELIEG